jgi:purine-binding chemotaxis protein CheW
MTEKKKDKKKKTKRKSGKKERVLTPEKKITLPKFGLAEDILGSVDWDPENIIKGHEGSGTLDLLDENTGPDDTTMKIVTFFLGKEEYGLPISQVREINRVPEITRVPNSRKHIMGVMNLRGKIIPVVNLKHRLELGDAGMDKRNRIVVVEYGSNLIGLMVESVSQVLNLSSSQIEDIPEEGVVKENKRYVKDIGKIEDRMILLFDLDEVLDYKSEPKS